MSFDEDTLRIRSKLWVSIPLEQGNVFRRIVGDSLDWLSRQSQSLWNRAMSFDHKHFVEARVRNLSQSLWNRAMSFDCSGVLEPCVARLPRATSQLFLMLE